MKIAIATVFLPRENIYWLEEWIRYHLFHIGIDVIYLYDNTGSLKLDHLPLTPEISVALSGKNLRGEDIASCTAHLSDTDIEHITNKIITKYGNRVHIIPWHPVDKQGIPCYGQGRAYEHFLHNYGDQFDWACLTDIDEFIVNTDFKEKITLFDKKGFNDVIIHPKLFMQRVGPRGPIIPALSITDCVGGIKDGSWKRVIKCSEIKHPGVHWGCKKKRGWLSLFNSNLFFYHYKMGPWCYKKMSCEAALYPKILSVNTDEVLKKVVPSLSLDQNVPVPLPKNRGSFEPGPRYVVLPEVSFLGRIAIVGKYIIKYLKTRYYPFYIFHAFITDHIFK